MGFSDKKGTGAKRSAAKKNISFFSAGFFLIEVSITLIIVSVMLVAFTTTFSSALKGIKKTRQFNDASLFAKNKMFEIMTDFSHSANTAPQSGTVLMNGYSYNWSTEFSVIEETEEQLYVLKMKILQGNDSISEIFTVIKAD